MADLEKIAGVIRDSYTNREVEVVTRRGYIELVGNRSCLGVGVAGEILNETNCVQVKAIHSSKMSGRWSHDSDGYRIWFSEIESEEVERTITETRYTIE